MRTVGAKVAAANSRAGLTLIEVLVVIAIVGLLIALLMPAVQRSREAARRVQCASSLRQLGLAVVMHDETKKRFPALGYWSASGPEIFGSWVIDVLPFIEQRALFQKWDRDQPFDDTTYSQNGTLSQTPLPLLACPSDLTALAGRGNQSYVVNAGFGWTQPADCPFSDDSTGSGLIRVNFDLDGDGLACPGTVGTKGDQAVLLKMGLFFGENWPIGAGTVRHHTFKSITDGTSTTVMIGENVRAGFDPNFNSTWATPDVERQSFIVSPYVCDSFSCSVGNVNYARANDRSALPFKRQAINSSLDQPEGEAPWPSSYHDGGVNFVFCDGHVKFVSDNIAGAVYAAIVSPQGNSVGGALKQGLIVGGEY